MTRLLPLLVLTFGCPGPKTPPGSSGDDATTAPPGESHREPEEGEAGETTEEKPTWDSESFGDPYFLETTPTPAVEGHVFKAIARHGGGCAEHAYSLDFRGVGRSMPPTALLTLKHNANEDACRALLITPLELDIHAALEGKGCFGRVAISMPPTSSEESSAGVFDIDPIGCDEAPPEGE